MQPTSLPSELNLSMADIRWQETSGESGARVFRLTQLGQPTRYLKISPRAIQRDLRLERDKLNWLRHRLPVPVVLAFAEDETQQYLLTSAVPGVDATEPALLENPPRIVRLLAHGLRQIHTVDVRGCPFDRSTDQLLADADIRVKQGLVDTSEFDEERAGLAPPLAFEDLRRQRGTIQDDLCLIHGDYCFPNIIIDPQYRLIAGFIDLGGAGAGDRYFDLALAERSIRRNVGPQWVDLFFEEYGLPPLVVDWHKIRFFQFMDEFF